MLLTSPEARLGDRPVGDSRFPYNEIIISWFDRLLGDEADAWQAMPKVQVFLMGAETWLTDESWPLPETETRTLFLASDTSARTLWGDGALEPAARDAGTDEVIADPHNPVPSLGGDLGTHHPVCVDQRPVECRADVLVYSTPVLTEPVAIAGDVIAELYVSADVEDADVLVKLVDVYPDGTAYNLASSGLRLRYRDGFERPARLVPGQICRVRIEGITTASYSRPATGSASRSPGPASRSGTATGTQATATTWPPTAPSRTSPCTTESVTSRRCTSAPTPARSPSTRRCPIPGPSASRDRPGLQPTV
jgi:putative CocE/NonD family hydrolase